MKRLLQEKVKIKKGVKCQLVHPKNRKDVGITMEYQYLTKEGFHVFHAGNKVIVCYSDTEFIILPTLSELHEMIDVTLDLGMQDLFMEYTDKLNQHMYNQ